MLSISRGFSKGCKNLRHPNVQTSSVRSSASRGKKHSVTDSKGRRASIYPCRSTETTSTRITVKLVRKTYIESIKDLYTTMLEEYALNWRRSTYLWKASNSRHNLITCSFKSASCRLREYSCGKWLSKDKWIDSEPIWLNCRLPNSSNSSKRKRSTVGKWSRTGTTWLCIRNQSIKWLKVRFVNRISQRIILQIWARVQPH